jgi:hypothetical protein
MVIPVSRCLAVLVSLTVTTLVAGEAEDSGELVEYSRSLLADRAAVLSARV